MAQKLSNAQILQRRRRAAIRQANRERRVDAMLVHDPFDIRYLSGLTEGSQTLLFGKDWSVLFTGKMFQFCAPAECPGTEVVVQNGGADKEIAKTLRKHGAKKLGFQEDKISLLRYRSLTENLNERRLVPTRELIAHLRAVKDDGELRLIRKAIRIAEGAFRELIGGGAKAIIGKTERQLGAFLENAMRSAGADRHGFQANNIIVGSGPNSANCHHMPTDRKARRGEPVLFDWGAEIDGYRSDITRVAYLDSAPKRIAEIHPIVLAGQQAAIKAMKPGAKPKSIDKAARGLITDAGFGEEFRHGLGHGLGLQIHEHPFMGRANQKPLRKNMVITVEPGIYFNGFGGVRLEDDIQITAKGRKNLNTLAKKLDEVILQ